MPLCQEMGMVSQAWVADTTPQVAPRLDKDIMTRGAGSKPHPPSVPNLPPTPLNQLLGKPNSGHDTWWGHKAWTAGRKAEMRPAKLSVHCAQDRGLGPQGPSCAHAPCEPRTLEASTCPCLGGWHHRNPDVAP